MKQAACILLLIILLSGCANSDATPNMDSRVQTAIANTEQAKASIDNAVQQTVTALQPIPAGTGTPPTPTPMPPVDASTLTEEELAAMIETAVANAYLYADQSSSTTTSATADGTITEEEYYSTYYNYYVTEAYIEYAESLINSYVEYYGEYADAAIDSLNAIEQDLNAISESVAEMTSILQQGQSTAQAAIDTINATAAAVKEKAAQIKDLPGQWKDQVDQGINDRENKFMNMAPTDIASDRDGALLQVFDYLDSFKAALGDGKINPTEMFDIAQRAANARASVDKSGGPALKNLLSRLDTLTRNASRGEWSRAGSGLSDFERALPDRPKRRP